MSTKEKSLPEEGSLDYVFVGYIKKVYNVSDVDQMPCRQLQELYQAFASGCFSTAFRFGVLVEKFYDEENDFSKEINLKALRFMHNDVMQEAKNMCGAACAGNIPTSSKRNN